MKKQFQSKSVPRGTRTIWRYLSALILFFALSIGQMWGTATNFHTFVAAGDTIVDLEGTGSTPSAKFTAVNSTNWAAVNTSSKNNSIYRMDPSTEAVATSKTNVYGTKLGSSAKSTYKVTGVSNVIFYVGTGTAGRIAYLDVTENGKSKVSEAASVTLSDKNNAYKMSYALDASKSYTLEAYASADLFCYAVKFTVGGGTTPVCPSGLSISGTKNYTEGEKIELTAALEAGNGAITYQWYKGGTAEANKLTGKTAAKLEIASCTGSDAGDYYCKASKSDCSDAVNAEAYTVTVATIQPTGTATISYALSGSTTSGTVTGVNSISGLSSSLTLSTLTLSGTKDGYSGGIKGCTSTTELVEADYVDVQFTVGSGYVFTPSAVTVQVNPFTATGAVKAVVKVMDAQPLEVASEELSCAKSTDNAVTFASGAFTNKKFEGTVHLRMYFYGPASDKAFYLKSPISITGTVAVAPTKYNVTFDKNDEGASGSQATLKYEAGAEVTLPACTFEAPTGKEFDAWTSTDVTISDGKFTMPSSAVTIKATWKTSSTKYTVTYKEGETTLDTEDVVAGTAPTGYSALESKNLASFVAWYNNADLAEEHKIADMSAETVSEATTYYGKWTYNYASSVNIEQWTLTNGAGKGATTKTSALIAQLGTNKFASNLSWVNGDLELDSLSTKSGRNEPYLGLKVKVGGKMLDFRLAKDSYVKVKFGEIKSTLPQVSINGGEYENMVITEKVWSYTATGNDYISIKTADANAVVFKQIMINEDIAAVTLPWRVTYNANGGTCATAEAIWSGSALILPNVTPAVPADYTFAGWYDEETGGVLVGAAGASYTPTDNATLFAHFAPVEYAIAYDGNGATSGSMVAGAAGWGTLVTPATNAFEKSGNVFSGWVITKTSDGSATGITFSEGKFEMPKYDVTLVAQWEDNSKVAVIVETNVKYETLAAAIAAATDGQTIQLLQNNNVTAQVEVAGKAITLDLAGYKIEYTGTSTLPSGVILVHNGASLTIDDSSDPDAGSIVSGADAYAAIALTKAGDDAANPAVLVINGGIFTGYYYGITGNGSRPNTQITINGGTITATATNDNLGIYHPQDGTLTVNGGTITAYASAIEMRAGTLVINGGTFTATASEFSCNPNGSGTTTVGAAIAIAQHTTKKDIEVTINGGTFEGEKAINESNPQANDPAPQVDLAVTGGDFTGEVSTVDVHEFISGGTFDAAVANENCATGWVPAPADPVTGKYSVKPKEGVEIIGVVTTGGTNKTVTGLYQGDATVNLDNDKKIGSGKYIYVTLKEGYTFEGTDVLVVDLAAKSNLDGGTKALEITTGVGNIDGAVWKSIAYDDYTAGENTISLEGIAAGQTSIGLKRSANQNAWVNGLKVYRPMKPMLTAITFNGAAGAIDEANKTVAITLPEATTDLAALTVVPTIIWNAAATENSIVVNDGAAWQEGANSYKLTDKDGDYTVYTITITLQGEAPAPVIATQPAGVAYCAGSEPTLEVVATGDELHYAWFKEAGVDDEAVGTDAASYTVEAAGTYYVIVTNHVDGKLDKSVISDNAVVTLNTVADITTQPTNKRDVVAGSEVTLSVVATNATGYQWYSCDDAEKHGAAAISGAETANYVFTCNANGFYYCVVGNACGDDITSNVVSVKLEPEGCNTFASKPAAEPYNYEQTGEWTFYNVDSNGADKSTDNVFEDGKNFDDEDVVVANTRRFALKFEKDVESVTLYGVGGNDKSFTKVSVSDEMKKNTYTELTATATKTDLTSQQHIFTIEDMIIPAGKYAWFELSGSLKFFKICYTAALAMPVLPTLADQELCASAAYETFDATITNEAACEGTVSYKWFSTADTENPVAETAEFTPTAEGTYYVVVTHAATGHITRTVQSDNLTVAHFDALTLVSNSGDVFQHMGTEATLSVVATGKNVAYVWYTCDVDGNNAEVISGASTASYVIASIAEGVQYYKVVISHDCDATTLSHVFKVEGWNQLEQVDVTASTVWDMNNVSASEINLASMTPSKQNVLLLLANIEGVNNNASFNSQALMFEGQRIGRTENNVKYVSGQYVQFNVTVPGMVSVTFASNGSAQRTILINGKQCSRTTNDGTYIKYDVAVEPGSVEIEDVQGYVRISKIEFKAEYSHNRPGLNPANIGTLCWTNNAILGGATLYELAGKNENNKLVFDEVAENRLEAGKPYIFVPENGNTEIKLYNTDTEAALTQGDLQAVNGMHGTFVNLSSADGDLLGNYVISKNHYIYVDSDNVTLKAYRAYITSLDDVEPVNNEPAPINGAPRRRIVMGAQGEQVATGIDNLEASEKPLKLMIDGQMYILRGEKLFDATGRLVK